MNDGHHVGQQPFWDLLQNGLVGPTPIRTLAFIPFFFLFQKLMEGLQRSRYGTMAEGKKPSKFSCSLDTRGKSLSSFLHSLTSNIETEEKPIILNCRRKS